MKKGPNSAPGARVEIGDAEWIIRRVDPSSDKGHQLMCDGISELVRRKTSTHLLSWPEDVPVKISQPGKYEREARIAVVSAEAAKLPGLDLG